MRGFSVPRGMGRALVGALLLAGLLVQPAAAAPRVRDFARLDAEVSRLQAAGASQKAIDAVFAANGLVRVDSGAGDEVVPLSASTSNDVTLGQPAVYEDTRFDYFVATATFQWKHNCSVFLAYKSQCVAKECLIVTGDCGGQDGFGIRLTRAVNEVKTTFYTHNTDGYQMPAWSNPEQLTDWGASWTEQDSLDNGRYNWDGGNVYFMFHLKSCARGDTYKVYSRLDHTWSNTTLTGFGVGKDSFNVSWTSEAARWTATNAVTTYWYPCGQ